jgi:hypothetical protein
MTASTPPAAAPVPPAPASAESGTAEAEGKYLNYVGHEIPWFVRLVWIVFWSASAWYVIRWLLPALQGELLSPP